VTDDDIPATPATAAPPEGEGRSRSLTRSLVEWGVVIVVAVLVALVVRSLVVQPFYIPSESMVPTLQVDDRVLVNKLSYRVGDVDRGDIVVFERPGPVRETDIKDLIKRVIGLPGDSLVIKEEQVFIDGTALDEGYLPEGTTTSIGPSGCTDATPCVIPEGEVWVMGDNRDNSEDSRWFGPIPESTIVGRAFVRIWPPGAIGLL
jgi:signal peptidase I